MTSDTTTLQVAVYYDRVNPPRGMFALAPDINMVFKRLHKVKNKYLIGLHKVIEDKINLLKYLPWGDSECHGIKDVGYRVNSDTYYVIVTYKEIKQCKGGVK